jgi:hypothetical protein
MSSSELQAALLALDEITAQRDEARRQLALMIDLVSREDRNLMQQELEKAKRMVIILNDSVHRVTAERDEARREVCYASTQPPRECAEDRGWDCFGQDTCKEAHDEETDKDPG